MFWLFYDFLSTYPREKKIWVKVHFVHETGKAVLVLCEGRKIWIAKARIHKVRLRRNIFEICTKENFIDN